MNAETFYEMFQSLIKYSKHFHYFVDIPVTPILRSISYSEFNKLCTYP